MSNPFQTGGALLADSPVYVERKADDQALAHLRKMDYLLFIEPRQQGKTSLLARLRTRLGSSRCIFAYVDVEDFSYESEESWFADLWNELSWSMGQVLCEATSSPPSNWQGWRDQMRSLAQFAEVHSFQIIIALDEVGSMAKAPWAEPFFTSLRKFYNQRAFAPFCKELTFVLSGAFHPRDLIKDDKISPFNIAQRVRLTDFTLSQVRELVGKGNWTGEQTTVLAERIHYWTDGQPYLTQLLCSYLVPDTTPADVDAGVARLFREDENHLPPMLERLNRDERLRKYAERILAGERIKFGPWKEKHRRQSPLELLGVIKMGVGDFCVVRNRIYERALAGISGETSSSPTPAPALHPGLNNALNHHASEPTVTLPDSQSSIGGKDMDYERGFQALKKCLAGTSTELQSELATVEERFWKNERAGRIFGSSENTRNECSQVIFSLNELALKHCGVSFNALCRGELPLASKKPSLQEAPVPASPPHRPSSGTTYHITGDGNVVGDGSGAQVIHREPSSAPETVSPPGVSVTLLTRIFPTAYCHNLIAKAFPLVTITLDNTGRGCDNAQVSAEAVVQGYSEPAVASLLVPRGQQAQIALLPMLRHKAVATLNEIRPASLRVTIHQHHAGRSQLLHDHTYTLQLHARDTALLAVKAPDGSTVDLTDYLVAWVTPRRPEIERLLRQAVEHHPDRQFIGYQGASTLAEAAVVVRKQARAIFAVLKQDVNLVYINSPLNLGTQAGQVTQRVRLPTESLVAGSSANCIDGTVLFASLLELASIEPLIVLVPRHAFVGWRIWSGVNRYEFLETTMIGNADFDAAQKSAQARYEEVLLKGYLSRGLFDPGGFARLIDVAACRTKGIHPLE